MCSVTQTAREWCSSELTGIMRCYEKMLLILYKGQFFIANFRYLLDKLIEEKYHENLFFIQRRQVQNGTKELPRKVKEKWNNRWGRQGPCFQNRSFHPDRVNNSRQDNHPGFSSGNREQKVGQKKVFVCYYRKSYYIKKLYLILSKDESSNSYSSLCN